MGKKDIVLDANIVLYASRYDDTARRVIAKIVRDCFRVNVSEQLEGQYYGVCKKEGCANFGLLYLQNELKVHSKYLQTDDIHSTLERLSRSKKRELKEARKDLHVLATALKGKCSIIIATEPHITSCEDFLKAWGVTVQSMEKFLE